MRLRTPAVSVFVLAICFAIPAQSPVPPPAPLPAAPAPLGKEQFRARREALVQALAVAHPSQRCVVLVRGGDSQPDMGAFRQEQDFLYLTGVAEPGLAMLLTSDGDGKLTTDELLVPPFSPMAATWDGRYLAPGDAAAERTGFATVGNVRALSRRLGELLAADGDGHRPLLGTLLEAAPRTGSTPGKAAQIAKAIADDEFDGRSAREPVLASKLRHDYPGLDVQGLEPLLLTLRANKSPAEITLLQRSAEIAAEGIAEAMKCTRPGLYEYQLAAVARYVFSLRGCGPDAYAAIVGAGPNGCILHYNVNDRQLADDDLIVMDYAATLQGYCSDVTRTFPASGKFSEAQRKLVLDVWEIQQALLAEVKPGASLRALGAQCARLLQERGYRSDHGPCHHVGLAVHDPSIDVLAPGMILTVEPGAYLRKEGIGCRIEDTVLVTADGCKVLSAGVPSHPDAIEKLMQQHGVIDVPVGLPQSR